VDNQIPFSLHQRIERIQKKKLEKKFVVTDKSHVPNDFPTVNNQMETDEPVQKSISAFKT
jgi:hypothetical protein